jgi:DNA repair exonuclease SbcCD nuclease subunit
MTLNKPIAVLCSDIHYNLQTLPLADASMQQAIQTANDLQVPLIVAGDLHDTKANIRGECMNAMINTIALADMQPYILVGNHDKLNEKSEANSLNFLGGLAVIVDKPQFHPTLNINFIPYQHDLRYFIPAEGAVNIVHQGLLGSNSGEYIQDKTAVDFGEVSGHRIISGHYHTRQTINLPRGGKWDFIGNPYTLNFAEANDPKKGFQVLYNDGSLEFVPTNLRKHIIIEDESKRIPVSNASFGAQQFTMKDVKCDILKPDDIVLVRVKGSKEDLARIDKQMVAYKYSIKQSFKLDLIPTDEPNKVFVAQNLTLPQQLDEIIEKLQVTKDRKETIKKLWKDL